MNKDYNYYRKEKQVCEFLTIIGYIILGISFISFLPAGMNGMGNAMIIMVFFLLGGILTGIGRKKFKNLSNEFKSQFLPQEIQKIFPDSTFDVFSGFHQDTIYGSHVLQKQDRYHSEDLIVGNYEGVDFKTADVKLQDVRRSGKSTKVVTVFLGRVYEFEFNKDFKSNLLLLQPGKFRPFGPWNRLKTESNQFNSELKLYATNENDAFYILTPHFMESLLKLDHKYRDQISFSFINNKLYIAVNTKIDTFDLKMFSPINRSIIDNYKEQLIDIKEFIHELNLDQNLFKNNL